MQPKCRRRISSEKSSVAEGEVIPSSSRQCGDSDESEGEAEGVNRLLRKKYQVEELEQIKLKMEAMEWDTRAPGYHETIQKCVVLFRKALINNFGNHKESDQLKEMRGNMARWFHIGHL